MDVITLGLSAAGVAVVPIGWVFKKSYATEKRLTALETNHKNIDTKLTSVEGKLDRLIERFL